MSGKPSMRVGTVPVLADETDHATPSSARPLRVVARPSPSVQATNPTNSLGGRHAGTTVFAPERLCT
jgi:hypothetical protein